MNELQVPLSTLTGADESAPGTVGAALPTQFLPPDTNFANNSEVVRQVQEEICPLIWSTRLGRRSQEQRWLEILRMVKLQHDGNQKYKGRSQAYLPIWARIEGTQVASLSRGLFPSDQYLAVTDTVSEDPAVSEPVQRYVQWELEENGRLRSHVKPWMRQFFRFGTAPMKVLYNKPVTTRKRGGFTKLPGLQGVMNQMVPDMSQYGLRLSERSLFSWFVYPTHAQTMDEATMVFEDVDVPRMKVAELLRKGHWVGASVNQVMDAYGRWLNRYAQDVQFGELAGADEMAASAGSPQGQMAVITECWTYMVLPSSAYAEGEDKKDAVAVRITLAGDEVLEVRRNPFWHQRPPYVVGRYGIEPGLFYGEGLGKLVASIQYLCNDFANQTNDVGAYTLNPMWKVVRGLMAGPMTPAAPGRIWSVQDQDAIQPVVPDVSLIGGAQGMLNMWLQMAQDWSGTPALAMGIGGSKSGKTATQSQILQNNVGQSMQDVVEDLEKDGLVPLMYLTWVNGMQFAPDELAFAVAGANIKMNKEQLLINPRMQWLASSQAMNRSQRVQQVMSLAQLVTPMLSLLNSQGYSVDMVSLIRRVWQDGLGLRGFDQFIRKMTPEEMMAQQQAMMMQQGGMPPGQGGPPGPQDQQGDRVRSALEQVTGEAGAEQMAPGEGEDFMQVRSEADEMAAMMGAAGGGF